MPKRLIVMVLPWVSSICSGVSEHISVKPLGVSSRPCMTHDGSTPGAPNSPKVITRGSPPSTEA